MSSSSWSCTEGACRDPFGAEVSAEGGSSPARFIAGICACTGSLGPRAIADAPCRTPDHLQHAPRPLAKPWIMAHGAGSPGGRGLLQPPSSVRPAANGGESLAGATVETSCSPLQAWRRGEQASVCVEASCSLLQARRRGSWLAAGTGEREREREHDTQHDSQHDSHVRQASPA